jgi:hypothetical protein
MKGVVERDWSFDRLGVPLEPVGSGMSWTGSSRSRRLARDKCEGAHVSGGADGKGRPVGEGEGEGEGEGVDGRGLCPKISLVLGLLG